MSLRLAEGTPVVAYLSFEDYVKAVEVARDNYHAMLSQELRHAKWKSVQSACSWEKSRRQGASILLVATKGALHTVGWSVDANDALVLSLQSTMYAYLCTVQRASLAELLSLLHSHLDMMLGYPDCCWGWTGPGVLRDLVRTSFMSMTPGFLLPVSRWPQHQLALLMATHARLGAGSGLCDFDSELLRTVLELAVGSSASPSSLRWAVVLQ